MIQLDRHAPLPVGEQLVQQLRYLLAAGRYRPGEVLPSTRELADQIGISFHTVRKAYQALEAEGLLEARQGAGFWVREPQPVSPSERLERGAALVQETIKQMIALGLREDEVDYLFQEQLQFLDPPSERRKILFAGIYREQAEACAAQITQVLQEPVEAILLADLPRHPDADLLVTPHTAIQTVLAALSKVEVCGVLVYPPPEALDLLARLGAQSVVGLATRYPDAQEPLQRELRHWTGFQGVFRPLPTESAERAPLDAALRHLDLVLYTPPFRRRLRPLLEPVPHVELTALIERASLEKIKASYGR